jgi:hypothetical protein
MKRHLILSLTLSVLAANAFAWSPDTSHDSLSAKLVVEGGAERTGANRIAADGAERTGANRIAADGAERTAANRIAADGFDRTAANRIG